MAQKTKQLVARKLVNRTQAPSIVDSITADDVKGFTQIIGEHLPFVRPADMVGKTITGKVEGLMERPSEKYKGTTERYLRMNHNGVLFLFPVKASVAYRLADHLKTTLQEMNWKKVIGLRLAIRGNGMKENKKGKECHQFDVFVAK